jgi:tRNA(fMet)-specific endonuclease VapC
MSSTPRAVLGTDILSLIMRQNPQVTAKAQNYLSVHQKFTFSIITRYEILRGLKAKNATTQLKAFETFCQSSDVLPISDGVILKAAEIYAELYQQGNLIGDADILIASTAIVENCELITNNEQHFSRVTGLKVDNWLK